MHILIHNKKVFSSASFFDDDACSSCWLTQQNKQKQEEHHVISEVGIIKERLTISYIAYRHLIKCLKWFEGLFEYYSVFINKILSNNLEFVVSCEYIEVIFI